MTKTEQIREIMRDLHANIISVNTGMERIIKLLEEQKQECVRTVFKEIKKRLKNTGYTWKGEKDQETKDNHYEIYESDLDTVLSIIKKR